MEASYIKDMQTNYLILESDKNRSNSYIGKMILNNQITGLLSVELRCIDSMDYFYYDISSKDSLSNTYKTQLLGYDVLKDILKKIIGTIERSREYLLNEEGFVLKPEYIYISKDEFIPLLCYYVDFSEPLLVQFSSLIEYFMGKVDYKDERAVLLVYALYKITKESNVSLEQLKEELYKDMKDSIPNSSFQENDYTQNRTEGDNNSLKYNKDMEDNLFDQGKLDRTNNIFKSINNYDINDTVDEKEVLSYSKKSYIITAISIVIIMAIFLVMFQSKLLYNSFGTKIDLIKLLCFVIVITCGEVLLLSKLFNKDSKIIRIMPNETTNYYNSNKDITFKTGDIGTHNQAIAFNSGDIGTHNQEEIYETQILQNSEEYEEFETEILYDLSSNEDEFYLEPADENEKIYIDRSPFIVGKNWEGVNYRISDASVSRFHARLSVSDDIISVTDLGSLNGTYINGIKLKEHTSHSLSVNDELFFSKCKYTVKKS